MLKILGYAVYTPRSDNSIFEARQSTLTSTVTGYLEDRHSYILYESKNDNVTWYVYTWLYSSKIHNHAGVYEHNSAS